MNERQLQLTIKNQKTKIEELLVLIDTLQTNLRSAVSCLDADSKKQITGVQSYKWSANWRDTGSDGYSTIEGVVRQNTGNPEKRP